MTLYPIQFSILTIPKNQSPIVSHYQAKGFVEYSKEQKKHPKCLLRLHHQRTIRVNSFLKVAVNPLCPIERVSQLVQKIAKQLQVHVYDELVVMGRTVDGSFSPQKLPIHKIIHCDNYIINSLIFFDYETGLYMIDAEQAATEIVVFDEGDSVDILEMEQRLKELDLSDYYSGEPIGIFLEPWYKRQPLAEIFPLSILMNGIFALLLTLMVVISIMNPTIMMVWERKGEILVASSHWIFKETNHVALVLGKFHTHNVGIAFVGLCWILLDHNPKCGY